MSVQDRPVLSQRPVRYDAQRPGPVNSPMPSPKNQPARPARTSSRRDAGASNSAKACGPGGASSPADPVREHQAAAHERTRRAHATEIGEDYVEAIADLIDITGEARVVDLAQCLGVTHVTVVRTIARLQRDGLVSARPYRAIFLTEEGRRLAELVKRRHETVVQFLLALGVSERTARDDAEGIEHHVSPETLAAFERFAGGAGRAVRTRGAAPESAQETRPRWSRGR